MWLANHFYKMIYLQTKRVSKNKFLKDSQLIHFSFVFDCLGETNQISCPTPTLFLLKVKNNDIEFSVYYTINLHQTFYFPFKKNVTVIG